MNLLIHIEINEINRLHFKKDIITKAAALFPELKIIDFDNHSDAFLIDAIFTMAKEAEKIAIVIDVAILIAGTGGVVKFLNSIIRLKKHHIMAVLNGNHEMLKKMVSVFDQTHFDLDLDAQKEKLLEFFRT